MVLLEEKRLGEVTEHRAIACWLWTSLLLGCSVCVAVIAPQRGSERHVVPSTLLRRWNTPLPRVDGEDHGESC